MGKGMEKTNARKGSGKGREEEGKDKARKGKEREGKRKGMFGCRCAFLLANIIKRVLKEGQPHKLQNGPYALSKRARPYLKATTSAADPLENDCKFILFLETDGWEMAWGAIPHQFP
jgi:hypothetical protein